MKYANRVVRVFVSSTFTDMHAEREELVKFIFPEIRKRCRERNVEFVDVDLRWGVTDEEKADGKVLPICLAEIERCRPYFIGILGERYGWVPKEIDHTLIEEQKWILEHRDKSVIEQEILYGVVEKEDIKGIAFFYFRDPDKSRLANSKSAIQPGLQNESEEERRKLALLKDKIRKS